MPYKVLILIPLCSNVGYLLNTQVYQVYCKAPNFNRASLII